MPDNGLSFDMAWRHWTQITDGGHQVLGLARSDTGPSPFPRQKLKYVADVSVHAKSLLEKHQAGVTAEGRVR